MSDPESTAPSHSTLIKMLHYGAMGLLLTGGLIYWFLLPSSLNPMNDPKAAEALALVQTHQAQDAPTLLQALTDRIQALSDRGKGSRLGEWQVEHVRDSQYLVRVWFREEGARQWFEREYVWRVQLENKSIMPMSNFAIELMPRELEGEESSSLPPMVR